MKDPNLFNADKAVEVAQMARAIIRQEKKQTNHCAQCNRAFSIILSSSFLYDTKHGKIRTGTPHNITALSGA